MKAALTPAKTLIGFAGSPWTVATYMVAGQGSREQAEARRLAYRDPGAVRGDHRADRGGDDRLSVGQIDAGAEAVQLFDSWAGKPFAEPVRALGDRSDGAAGRRVASGTRTFRSLAFPRAPAASSRAYARETEVDAIGLDETVDPAWAARELPADLPVQGNLDPLALIAGGKAMEKAVAASLTPSPAGRTSSISATASSRTRRSRHVEASCWRW